MRPDGIVTFGNVFVLPAVNHSTFEVRMVIAGRQKPAGARFVSPFQVFSEKSLGASNSTHPPGRAARTTHLPRLPRLGVKQQHVQSSGSFVRSMQLESQTSSSIEHGTHPFGFHNRFANMGDASSLRAKAYRRAYAPYPMMYFCNPTRESGMPHFYDGYHLVGMHLLWWVFWILSILIMFVPYELVRRNRRKKKQDMISKT
ncbi:MAG: hypothetical protein ABI552_02685 [Casimicrobiaceae bacterium]